MKKAVVALLAVLIVGCTTNDTGYNKPYPKSQLFCPKDTIEYCEGRTPRDLECTCVRKRVLEEQLRKIVW
tara:strand:- start:1308 stop:1517 length:210 start_codon:yes stop_codon:yes gene_type:complete